MEMGYDSPRDLPQIHAGIRIGIDVVLDQRAENRGGKSSAVPTVGR